MSDRPIRRGRRGCPRIVLYDLDRDLPGFAGRQDDLLLAEDEVVLLMRGVLTVDPKLELGHAAALERVLMSQPGLGVYDLDVDLRSTLLEGCGLLPVAWFVIN